METDGNGKMPFAVRVKSMGVALFESKFRVKRKWAKSMSEYFEIGEGCCCLLLVGSNTYALRWSIHMGERIYSSHLCGFKYLCTEYSIV